MRSDNQEVTPPSFFMEIIPSEKNERLPFGTASRRFIKSSGKAFHFYITAESAPI